MNASIETAAHRRQDQRGAESRVRYLPKHLPPNALRVECDHADRVAILARHQIGDDGFEIGFAEIGFRECRAKLPVIIETI
jgi:hypothetical protein